MRFEPVDRETRTETHYLSERNVTLTADNQLLLVARLLVGPPVYLLISYETGSNRSTLPTATC